MSAFADEESIPAASVTASEEVQTPISAQELIPVPTIEPVSTPTSSPEPVLAVTPSTGPTPQLEVTPSNDQGGEYEFNVESSFNPSVLKPNVMFTAKMLASNISSTSYTGIKDVLLIVALYDKNNTMVNVSYLSKGIPYLGVEALSAGFKLPSDLSGCTVKCFLWDGTDMKNTSMIPISNVNTITYNPNGGGNGDTISRPDPGDPIDPQYTLTPAMTTEPTPSASPVSTVTPALSMIPTPAPSLMPSILPIVSASPIISISPTVSVSPIASTTPVPTPGPTTNIFSTPLITPETVITPTPTATMISSTKSLPAQNGVSNQVVISLVPTMTVSVSPALSPTPSPVVTATFVTVLKPTPEFVAQPVPKVPSIGSFNDVDHWSRPYIKELLEKGILAGYADGTIRPDKEITRTETVAIIAKAIGLRPAEKIKLEFTDQKEIPLWAKGYIQAAADQGIAVGYPDKTYKPNQKISRAEVIAIVYKAFRLEEYGPSEDKFKPKENIQPWARGYVEKAYNLGLIRGYRDNTLKTDKNISRAEIFVILINCLHLT